MLVGLKRISTALGLLAASAAVAEAQGTAPVGGNQATANAVASSLKLSPTLSGYRIEIETRNGMVTLTGAVATPAQRAEALARARIVPGVTAVADHIAVAGDRNVRPVRFQSPQAGVYVARHGRARLFRVDVVMPGQYQGTSSMPGQYQGMSSMPGQYQGMSSMPGQYSGPPR